MVRVAYVWLGLHPTSPQISPLIPTRPKTTVTPLPLPAQASIVRLNLKEARDQLARRLAEVSPDVSVDETIASATREASILLDEVWEDRAAGRGEGAAGRDGAALSEGAPVPSCWRPPHSGRESSIL